MLNTDAPTAGVMMQPTPRFTDDMIGKGKRIIRNERRRLGRDLGGRTVPAVLLDKIPELSRIEAVMLAIEI